MSRKPALDRGAIEALILDALRMANQSRPAGAQLEISPTATIFGAGSALDSLGFVALMIDIEDALHDRGYPVTLTDARAMSQSQSPFRGVQPLVDYVETLLTRRAE